MIPNFQKNFIFHVWRDLQSERINDFLPVCKYCMLCVNFQVVTFQVHIRLLFKFVFPIATPGKVILTHSRVHSHRSLDLKNVHEITSFGLILGVQNVPRLLKQELEKL